MIILIDNGHGSNTAGKCSPDKKHREYKWSRDFSSRLETALKANGYNAKRIVTETIDACADTGAVRVSGVLWTAKCATGERIEKGRHVTIERVEGAKLYVKPAEMPCEKA